MTALPLGRRPHPLAALGWLFLLHLLADLIIAILRSNRLGGEWTNLWAAALPRSQLCLLAVWLALGREPLSWRLCGLAGGGCTVFTVFTRLLLPGRIGLPTAHRWYSEEWLLFFDVSGPGGVLVDAPAMVLSIAAPLIAWRTWRALRLRHEATRPNRPWRFQFRFQDVAIWTATFGIVLVAANRTAPYPGWWGELGDTFRSFTHDWRALAVRLTVVGPSYATGTLTVVWCVYSSYAARRRRLTAALLVAGAVGVAALGAIVQAALGAAHARPAPPIPALFAIGIWLLAMLATALSLLLARLHQPIEYQSADKSRVQLS